MKNIRLNRELEDLCINTIRMLSADAVQNANAGHPGMPMGAAAMALTLWTQFLKHNPRNPQWFGRDRFVLSAGHGSMLLYSLLYLSGYDLPLEEIKHFRKWGSKAAGHPERGLAPGAEVTTGPLGQGFANGVAWRLPMRGLRRVIRPARHLLCKGWRPAGNLEWAPRAEEEPTKGGDFLILMTLRLLSGSS